jgi:uncharacterized protein
MRVVLDTNVLLSALFVRQSTAALVVNAWRRGAFYLLTCELQLQEIRAVTRRPQIRALIRPAMAGELVNQLKGMATWIEELPPVNRSPDPFDNFLLSMAQAGQADALVSGDKRGVLALKSHGACQIVTLRRFVDSLNIK